ncbi:hypothetical protein CORC01_11318 [Colletotrichum orchidophilum]|uniref:Uncharacterized protein n=1 Tax=Colletotrichum orchidophilum TaxID=1209926 RepID=A0A1G4AW28_9PEZI|nr:uncharacterized protein CORC01_11318 [Colletotrichum orchidophilum]OHE93369.1 hypothetical protein CORC01_11318 [Colletotrichum orchidophilum]
MAERYASLEVLDDFNLCIKQLKLRTSFNINDLDRFVLVNKNCGISTGGLGANDAQIALAVSVVCVLIFYSFLL